MKEHAKTLVGIALIFLAGMIVGAQLAHYEHRQTIVAQSDSCTASLEGRDAFLWRLIERNDQLQSERDALAGRCK